MLLLIHSFDEYCHCTKTYNYDLFSSLKSTQLLLKSLPDNIRGVGVYSCSSWQNLGQPPYIMKSLYQFLYIKAIPKNYENLVMLYYVFFIIVCFVSCRVNMAIIYFQNECQNGLDGRVAATW